MNAECRTAHRRQRVTGWLATGLFVAALFSLVDAFRGGFFGNQGYVELLPGTSRPISGPMPREVKSIADMEIEGMPEDGSVRLAPGAHFSGFWFGGDMWRGSVEAAPDAREGEWTITVRDDAAGKQNPTLVFRVRVWQDQAAKNAHSPSWITRKTGLKPFACAGVLAFGGLLAMALNYKLGQRWTRLLHAQGCGEIYKAEPTEEGLALYAERPAGLTVAEGFRCRLRRPDGEPLGSAVVLELRKSDLTLLAAAHCPANTGDIVCLTEEAPEEDEESA